jgi:hypothetical protein
MADSRCAHLGHRNAGRAVVLGDRAMPGLVVAAKISKSRQIEPGLISHWTRKEGRTRGVCMHYAPLPRYRARRAPPSLREDLSFW